ncbi:prepilin-type N-terminal cleavage/methylation domain-containing protein [Alicyclobacillus cycloheptanicus]|uniref:General secretion pathway protein G n=1 Tax=Alicyclobacillus cycloheptanicus TaxID=1457 RepID=A0ABT9XDF2_9BACL|nr:prepilin-type N-terminal cleavage/methylation domain-containing protein [Alicyclobacillus cycloheptanicus]MDQ0188333.1 general secretion pathway protein G [Alicyclobacillus cycloheptanicus]WDM01047.1 prepilin-type N-terminal cleavage/methylation domain-containing protein [Alicyclobacillus cycloheptanicus]
MMGHEMDGDERAVDRAGRAVDADEPAVERKGRSHALSADHGFTLMEMVVAVFVVAVMIAVVTPHLMGAGSRAETVACEQDQQMIRAALAEYQLLYHAWPAGNTTDQLQELVDAQLLDSVPTEPSGGNFVITESANQATVSCDVHGELDNAS